MNNRLTSKKINDAVLIGGLVFNDKPLQELCKLFENVQFIDINKFTFTEAKQQVINLIQSAKRQIALIGYSMGGLVALSVYKQLPASIKLILINSSPFFMQDKDWHGISYINYKRLLSKLSKFPLCQFIDHFICMSSFPNISKYCTRLNLVSEYCEINKLTSWLDLILTIDLRKNLNKATQPILIILSEYDCIVPTLNSYNNRYITKTILPNSSHASLNTYKIKQRIESFLSC